MQQSLRFSLLALIIAAAACIGSTASAAVKIDISTYSLDFGTTQVGGSTDRTFTITNESSSTNSATIQLHSPSTDQYTIVGGWDPFTLSAGQCKTITIRFTPTSTGTITDQILITDNGDGSASPNPATIHFTGNGSGNNPSDTTLKVCTCSWPNSMTLDFGTVTIGVTGSERFTILDNSSAQTLRHLIGSVSGTHNPFSITFGQGSFDLASGYGHDVVVGFTPTTPGSFFDSIVINSNTDDPSTRRIVIYLIGNAGQNNPQNDTSLVINFNGTVPVNDYIDFGTVLDSTTASFTFVIQDGSSPQTHRQLVGVVTGPNSPFAIASGSGVFNLNTGGLWTVHVTFSPMAPLVFDDSIVIISNADAINSRRIVLHLHGTGKINNSGNNNGGQDTTAALSISGLTQVLNFGLVKVNDLGLRYFTITNTSQLNILVTGNTTSPKAPFSIVAGGGPFSLMKTDAPRSVFVEFQPTQVGQFYDSIVVTSTAPNATRTIIYLVGASGTGTNGVAEVMNGTSMTAYPNPFTTTNTLKLNLAAPSAVKIAVYNMLGQEVARIADGMLSSGPHTFDWNATSLGNGTYFYRAQIGSETRTARVVLSR